MAVGSASMLVGGVSSAPGGNMMNSGGLWGGGWMGRYGGYRGPILLALVVDLVVWVVLQERK